MPAHGGDNYAFGLSLSLLKIRVRLLLLGAYSLITCTFHLSPCKGIVIENLFFSLQFINHIILSFKLHVVFSHIIFSLCKSISFFRSSRTTPKPHSEIALPIIGRPSRGRHTYHNSCVNHGPTLETNTNHWHRLFYSSSQSDLSHTFIMHRSSAPSTPCNTPCGEGPTGEPHRSPNSDFCF